MSEQQSIFQDGDALDVKQAPALCQITQADAISFLRALDDETVDLILTDPAYESLEKHRAIGTTTRLTRKWFPIFRNIDYPALFAELYRVLKRNSHCYVFCDQATFLILAGREIIDGVEQPSLVERAGFRFWKGIVWDKLRRGMGYHYPASHELILFLEKGKRKLRTNKIRDVIEVEDVEAGCPHCGAPIADAIPDVLKHQSIRTKGAYPTEKPEELIKILINESSAPGDLVLDCFGGSFVTASAALSLCRRFTGCDISEDAIAYGHTRLGLDL